MNAFFLYILSLLAELSSLNDRAFGIKFGLFNQKSSSKDIHLINNIFYNGIYLNLSIGMPPQRVPLELDMNTQIFSISNKAFNKNQSSTYEDISKNEIFFDYDDIERGYNSKDIFILNNKTTNKINFLLGTKYPVDRIENLGIIGLSFPRRYQVGYPFFESFKNSEVINSRIWTIKYNNNKNLFDTICYNKDKDNIIGEFIFGDQPHNYESDNVKYNESEYIKVPALSIMGTIYWDISFNNIYLNFRENRTKRKSKAYFSGERKAKIMINFSYMLGPSKFLEFIKENFFSQYINDNICFEKRISNSFSYIECDVNIDFKVESFPDLSFEHIDFETIFNLTYKDLFVLDERNKKYLFLIFKEDYSTNWVLGSVFLRKFQLVFDEDSKTIGYYKQPQMFEVKETVDKNNNSSNRGLLIILIILFTFIVLFLGLYIQRKFFNKGRKIRANELEENFSYEGKFNNSKGEEIKYDNKIIN